MGGQCHTSDSTRVCPEFIWRRVSVSRTFFTGVNVVFWRMLTTLLGVVEDVGLG